MELDFPAGEDYRRTDLMRFGDALDPIRRMLTKQNFRSDADVHFRVRQRPPTCSKPFGPARRRSPRVALLPTPGHSVLRPVIDSCDLLDLFAEHPEQAEKMDHYRPSLGRFCACHGSRAPGPR